MRHMPNDTITVTLTDAGQFTTVFGDPGFPIDARGGNDTLTATISSVNSFVTLVGDDTTMLGHSHGGNDSLVANVEGFENGAVLIGDAQSMFDNAIGGNDTLHADATNSIYSEIDLYGDAGGNMSGDTKGGNDSLTALTGSRAFDVFGGDAGGSMTDNAHGGNDTLDVTQGNIFGAAELAGDAVGSMSDNAVGGNDNLTFTMASDAEVVGATLSGDAGTSMTDNAHGGDDTLTVVVNGDPSTISTTLIGDAPSMSGSAHGGNDVLNGGARDDSLYGDAESYTPSAPGSITGGKDVLNGGGGNDRLWGGPNDDTFVFKTGSGMDVINDFDRGNLAVGSTAPEHDVINVHDYGFASWAALSSLISDDSSGNAVVHLTASDAITLEGVHTAALHPTDFII
jgi:Ca2+-binding RTX toxin-like protein